MAAKCSVTSCCCGCTLRTGAISTAIFCLISAILNMIVSVRAAFSDHNNAAWFTVVVNVITFIIAVVLIYGVMKERPRLIHTWVYIQTVLLILAAIGIIVISVTHLDIGTLIVGLLAIVLVMYFIVVCRSYALQLESGGGSANTV